MNFFFKILKILVFRFNIIDTRYPGVKINSLRFIVNLNELIFCEKFNNLVTDFLFAWNRNCHLRICTRNL